MLRLALPLLVLLAASPLLASAQSPDPRRDAEARALFDAGAAAFDEGRFDEALERFRRAYELSGRPELLYNIAAAADRGGHDDEAREAYVAYVAAVPDAPNRSYVESRIEVLRARLAGGEVPSPSADGPPTDDVPVDDTVEDASRSTAPDPTAAIVLFASAGVTGAAAIVTGALGLSARAELDAACPMRVCSDPALRARGEEMAAFGIATDVLAGASLALAVAGIVAALLAPSGANDAVSVGPGALRVRF